MSAAKIQGSIPYSPLIEKEKEILAPSLKVDLTEYEWRIIPRALLQTRAHAAGKGEWELTETELKILPYFIDSMMQNKAALAVSLGKVNAKGVRSLIVELENPITKAKLVFEASSKKHSRRPSKTKEAPRLSLSSAKMLLIQRAGLAPASTPHSAPSGELTVAESAGEVKQNYAKKHKAGAVSDLLVVAHGHFCSLLSKLLNVAQVSTLSVGPLYSSERV